MPAKIRITHMGSSDRLLVRTIRQDVAGGEPHALGTDQEIEPGEARVMAIYSGCAIVITREQKKSPV
jgi:hypothetical protein